MSIPQHHIIHWCTDCLVGALLALASGKAERRQVHPLKLASVQSGICGRIFSAVGSVISVYSVGGFSQAAASV